MHEEGDDREEIRYYLPYGKALAREVLIPEEIYLAWETEPSTL